MAFIVSLLSLLTISGVTYSVPLESFSSVVSAVTGTGSTSTVKESSLEKTEVTLKQAIGIVEKRKLNECVARLICELSCNPDTYGQKGHSVYETLKKFESNTMPNLAYYMEAKNRGQGLTKSKCTECFQLYVKCKTSTETMLRMASALSIKS